MKKMISAMLVAMMCGIGAEAQKIKSVNDLMGQYANMTTSMKEDPRYAGSSATVLPKGDNEIVIYNLFDYGTELTAEVDLATGKLSVKSQLIYTDDNYGPSDFTAFTIQNDYIYPDRKTPVEGAVDLETGKITLGSWGVFLNSGLYEDHFFDVIEKTELLPANGVMKNVYYKDATGAAQFEDDEINVHLRYNDKGDEVIVDNFGDHGMSVNIKLDGGGKAIVERQMYYDMSDQQYGDFYIQPADWAADKYDGTTLYGKWDENGITFGNWTGSSSSGYYMGKIEKTTITFTDDSKFTTGIKQVATDTTSQLKSIEYYAADGQRRLTPASGLNIQIKRYADGRIVTRKVVEK